MYSKSDILALVLIAKIKIRSKVREARRILHEPMLTCCLFPHNHEIERESLIQLWMAGGFLEDARLKDVVFQHMGRRKGQTTQMEDVGNCCIDLFEKRKLISASRTHNLTGKMTYIINLGTIKNMLNEVSTSTKDLYTMIKDSNALNGSMQSWHVSLAYDEFDQTTFKALRKFHDLRTLLFIPNYGSSLKQIPSTFFLVIKLLRALDLSGSYITELPISIGNLTKLRYLDCSFTPIEGLPESIGHLHELQTLKLKECNHLFELPKGMKDLVSLRHLDFDVLGQLTSMPQGIGALTEFRTLSAFIIDNNRGRNIGDLKYLNNLSGSICISGLENLCHEVDVKVAALRRKNRISKLQLRWNLFQDKGMEIQQDSLTCIDELIPNVCLEELQLLCYPLSRLPHWMADEDLKNLVSITLIKCENIELNTSLGELPNLKYLDITQMNGVRKIDCCFCGQISYPAFWSLETLVIDGMSTLEAWEDVKTYDFPRLLKLIIKHCPKLAELPFLPLIDSLKHLEISRCKSLHYLTKQKLPGLIKDLIINECPLLKLKCSKDGEDWDKIEHVPNIWIDLKDIHLHQDDCSEDDGRTTDSLSDDFDYSEDSDIADLVF